MPRSSKLTPKQRRFVDLYDGNATEAARLAGYKGSADVLNQVGYENLRKPEVLAAITERERMTQGPRIAKREDLQGFWTQVLENENYELRDRLKASELLARSQAMFVERIHTELSLEALIAPSMDIVPSEISKNGGHGG